MKTINKFHSGMLKASALAVLNAIASDKAAAIVATAAKLVLLATKLNVVLQDVLPKSVMLLITNVLNLFALKAKAEHLKETFIDVAFCFMFRTSYLANRADYEKLASLVMLPAMPALKRLRS